MKYKPREEVSDSDKHTNLLPNIIMAEKRFIIQDPEANPIKLFWCKLNNTFCKLDYFIIANIFISYHNMA